MKSEARGGCYGSTELPMVCPGASWYEIFGTNGEDFLFLLFLAGGATCCGPQRSRARGIVARRERTLDGEDRCKTIRRGGKVLV